MKATYTLLLFALLALPAWAVELDQNSDGKLDDEFIPSTLTRDTELSAALANLPSASLPSWLPSTGPTADNQIIQATAAGSSSWTDVFDGLINDGGTGTDDLLSAAEIASRMTSKMAAPGPIGSATPSTGAFTTVTAASFDPISPASGETGEIGFQEDPANGNNTITLKAPANLVSDVILTLPAGVAPASATATGTPGQWWYDANYWYVCIATNTWVRSPLATW